ncbi:MAG: hypothetical protein BHW65_00500 [Verrucomicrobia bacterium CAG:312_58_20]|nr:MAG: hypothetical protein BHW65_00500 [Verrucomicrobia bacterium CAG:312_58_20]
MGGEQCKCDFFHGKIIKGICKSFQEAIPAKNGKQLIYSAPEYRPGKWKMRGKSAPFFYFPWLGEAGEFFVLMKFYCVPPIGGRAG